MGMLMSAVILQPVQMARSARHVTIREESLHFGVPLLLFGLPASPPLSGCQQIGFATHSENRDARRDSRDKESVKQEIADELPHGVNTSGEVMLCAIDQATDAESVVGYLWYRPKLATRSAYIKDFHIFTPQQGKGFGKQVLNALEAELVRAGFDRIKLRVAQDNKRAMHLMR